MAESLAFTILYDSIKEMVLRNSMFRPILEEIKLKLDSLMPIVIEMSRHNEVLDRPPFELEGIEPLMADGIELIRKCSKLKSWEMYKKYKCSNQLLEFQNRLDVQLQLSSYRVREARNIIANVQRFETQLQRRVRMQNQIYCDVPETPVITGRVQNQIYFDVPETPVITVGLDVPLRELKMKLLNDDQVSMLVLTAPAGCGKTHLASMFCQDEEVKDMFKDNIFFVTVSKRLNFNLIVQGLYQRKSTETTTFGDEVTAFKWLHKFLKEEEQTHILLVLDNVWPESKDIVEKFDEVQMPNFKVLVTSRSYFTSCGFWYRLNYILNDVDAMTLFRHSARLEDGSSNVRWNNLAREIVEHCKGNPLSIIVVGKSLRGKSFESWIKKAMEWSEGLSVIDTETEVLLRLKSSLDALDGEEAIIKDCFLDLASFPEGEKIPVAALIDMWGELYEQTREDHLAVVMLQELSTRSLADLIVTSDENVEGDDYYSEHFVTQHDILRELAIYQTKLDPSKKRLIINRCNRDKLSKNLAEQTYQRIKPRLVSISSDGAFSSILHNIQLADVEVLVLNFNTKNYASLEGVERMGNLKALIVTNHGIPEAELSNFQLLNSVLKLKRIRLEGVTIPSMTNNPIQLNSLIKISLFMCSIGEAFSSCSFQISDAFPYVEEMIIDYCNDLEELPDKLCHLVRLKKLCVTNCHKLSALPEDIGKLAQLEVLRLRFCTELVKLPRSLETLHKLNLLDISHCISITELPENIGQLSNLRTIDMRCCYTLQDLPISVLDLELVQEVICDEWTQGLWEPFLLSLQNVEIRVVKEEAPVGLEKKQGPNSRIPFYEPQKKATQNESIVDSMITKSVQRIDNSGAVHEPSLVVPSRDLEKKVLKDDDKVQMPISPGESGKSTLPTVFFLDEEIKDRCAVPEPPPITVGVETRDDGISFHTVVVGNEENVVLAGKEEEEKVLVVEKGKCSVEVVEEEKQNAVVEKEENMIQKNIENQTWGEVLERPVGLDVPLRDLMRKLLEPDGVSRLVLTAPGGGGKTTLATMFFQDERVKCKFEQNMFFIVVSNNPSLELIVQELYRQKGTQPIPKNIGQEENAVQWLEIFMEEVGQDPLLLVLDDVWSGQLLETFSRFDMSNKKILVTSRSEFTSFGPTYKLDTLDDEDTITLFCDSACIGDENTIPEDVKQKILDTCKGFPLIIKVFGRSIYKQPIENLQETVKALSARGSILDFDIGVLLCLKKSLEPLDHVTNECFLDLGSFPEDKRTSAGTLIDMWLELYPELQDDSACIKNIHKLSSRSLAKLDITRKEKTQLDGYYSEHFVTQHDVLRQLAMYQAKEPIQKRIRLNITDTCGDNVPKWLIKQYQQKPDKQPLKARLLSISSDGMFSREWNTVQLPEVEVLLLNMEARNCAYVLPEFVQKMSKLKVIVVTNYGSTPADLSNFEIVGFLPYLKRIRLECVSIPSITKNRTQFNKLEKISLSLCGIGEAFCNSSIQIPGAFPKLLEINIDNCNDLVTFPAKLCDIVGLKKLSITKCDKLEAIPVEIEKLVNLELLRLRSCTELRTLPPTLQYLKKLSFFDIADCVSLKELPEEIGTMSSLRKINMTQCSALEKLPSSVSYLDQLKEVVCDEETAKLWEPYLIYLGNIMKLVS